MNGQSNERKVLVVDDEPQILTSIQGLLEDDLRVLTTTDPEEGLRLLREEEVAVILSDQRMPRMTGDQFLMRAREVSGGTRVLITGYSDLNALVEAVNNAQIYAYVSKPWDPAALRLTIIRAAEHYEMLKALNRERELVKSLVEHLPEGVCLLDAERRLRLANSPAQEYLAMLMEGTKPGEAIARVGGYPIEEVLVSGGNRPAREVAIEGPPKRVFTVEARPIAGETLEGMWALLVREVTEERKVLERAQQQDRLAAVGQLAAGIAHDFNNLLTVMMGFAQMVEIHPDTPDAARRDLKTIFSQGQRASQMIRQILDFSRRNVVERKPVDLVPFLKEATKLLERTLPNIRVGVTFDRGDCVVEANLTQLQQVITNLAVNARDAMPEGGELRVGLSRLRVGPGGASPLPGMGPGEWVVCAVSDTGAGMPPEVLAHIYEPFFTTKAPGKGTGLGLAQVYGIVKQHGGYIDVKSAVGKGTTFTVYLPLVAKAGGASRKPEGDIPKGRGETVLVVEDQEEVRQVARVMLEHLNYRVLTAGSGREALEVYDRGQDGVALVLTDMVMPEMSGMELMKALRKRDVGMRVAVMTGYPLKEERGLPPGIVGWLEKPLTLEQVARVVSKALKRER